MENGEIILTLISSTISMIGSITVALTWMYPIENRNKHGRILLLWLSVADFFSSLTYFISAIIPQNYNLCKTLGIIAVFFPVSSFIWADTIAFYLYLIIVKKKAVSVEIWKQLIFRFHLVSWGLAGICSIIVSIPPNVISSHPTDGADWCWVNPNLNPKEKILWQLAGGKLIEWASCFLILPYLYISAIFKLRRLDQTIPLQSDDYHESIHSSSTTHSSSFLSPLSTIGQSMAIKVRLLPPTAPLNSTHSNSFNQFYLKMALAPIFFFLIRLWGSLNQLLLATNHHVQSLSLLQAFFDPLPGFVNACIFVFSSGKNRDELWRALQLAVADIFHFFGNSDLQTSDFLEDNPPSSLLDHDISRVSYSHYKPSIIHPSSLGTHRSSKSPFEDSSPLSLSNHLISPEDIEGLDMDMDMDQDNEI